MVGFRTVVLKEGVCQDRADSAMHERVTERGTVDYREHRMYKYLRTVNISVSSTHPAHFLLEVSVMGVEEFISGILKPKLISRASISLPSSPKALVHAPYETFLMAGQRSTADMELGLTNLDKDFSSHRMCKYIYHTASIIARVLIYM